MVREHEVFARRQDRATARQQGDKPMSYQQQTADLALLRSVPARAGCVYREYEQALAALWPMRGRLMPLEYKVQLGAIKQKGRDDLAALRTAAGEAQGRLEAARALAPSAASAKMPPSRVARSKKLPLIACASMDALPNTYKPARKTCTTTAAAMIQLQTT
jgi:hypothetical protein